MTKELAEFLTYQLHQLFLSPVAFCSVFLGYLATIYFLWRIWNRICASFDIYMRR
jgi:hypothetical protein